MGLFKKKNTDMEEDLIPVASEAYKQAYKKIKTWNYNMFHLLLRMQLEKVLIL